MVTATARLSSYRSNGPAAPTGEHKAEVTGLTHARLTWDPVLNLDNADTFIRKEANWVTDDAIGLL